MDDTRVSLTDNPIDDKSTMASVAVDGTGTDVRLQRIVDYIDESVAKVNAFEANVGAVNGDLLLMAYRLKQALEDALQQGPAAFDELEQLIPAMDQFLKVTKQIDRFSQFAIKLGDGKAIAKATTLAPIKAGSGVPSSEDSAS